MNIDDKEIQIGFSGIGIPAEVLFHPTLNPTEQKLFGLIRNISKSSRGCWATNRWLGSLLDINPITISGYIANLQKEGFLIIEFVKKPKTITGETERRIFIDETYTTKYRLRVEKVNEAIHNGRFDPKEFYPPKGKKEGGSGNTLTEVVIEEVIEKDLKEESLKTLSIPTIKRHPRPIIKTEPTPPPKVDRSVRPKIKYINLFPTPFQESGLFRETWLMYETYRMENAKKKGLLSDMAAKLIRTELLKLCKDDITLAIEIVTKTIRSGWTDVYPLSGSQKGNIQPPPVIPTKQRRNIYAGIDMDNLPANKYTDEDYANENPIPGMPARRS